MKRFAPAFIAFAIALFAWVAHPAIASASVDPQQLSNVVQELENLDRMRSNLASTLEGRDAEPTLQTFKQVCKPVGMRAKQLSQENPWQVKQLAGKYRNPAHAPDTEPAEVALKRFQENPDLIGFWQHETLDGTEGVRYYRRIDVEASCLACHGAKASRPQFVKDKYPQDRAYDFEVGDLRGMYAAFIPEVRSAMQQALQN